MAEPAIKFLLENLAQIVRYYYNLTVRAKTELELLQGELRLLKGFLQQAATKFNKEIQFKEYERQIREVVYDAEDTIETCLTHAAKNKRRRLNVDVPRLAQEVKSLRENKIRPLFDDAMTRFAIIQIGDTAETSAGRSKEKLKKVPLIREDNVVGFKDEEEILMKCLFEEKKSLDVISIIGMPGLGKTTLAWKIYKSKAVQYQFLNRIWVYVSQDFNIRDVLLSILRAFTNDDMSNLAEDKLSESVRNHLGDKQFLLVLDDVWTVEAWNEINKILPKDNKIGKVLITSRDIKVGRHANVNRAPHNLRFFKEEESWELLQLEVFGNENCPPVLEETGKCIARECDGLPLAVVVIGGILIDLNSNMQSVQLIKDDWVKVSKNVSEYVRNEKGQHISDIVEMSYNKLSDDLRDCFLYMGVFPEDYEINAWTLTCLWIAEGFVEDKTGKSLEKTARENLNELINRNLVMIDKRNPNGQVKTCRVHDVIRAFCITKATFKEQNLFTEIKLSKNGVFEPPIFYLQKYRRISIHSNLEKFLSERFKDLKIRSFMCFYKESFLLPDKQNSVIADTCNLLRVLDSKSFKFNTFPDKVTRLSNLRYITLSCVKMGILPGSLNELWNLQTLVIDTESSTLEVKAKIWNLIQLRHFKTKASIVLPEPKEGEVGENLQTLSRLSPESCTTEVFKKAPNLKRLGIKGKLETLVNSNTLKELNSLRKLKLMNGALENPLTAVPFRNSFPPNLKHLTLSNTSLDWNHIPTLGMIVGLQVLKLKDNAFTGQTWNTTAGGFSSLRYLLISNSGLVSWETSSDHFPVLRCLVLQYCNKLEKIPLCLAQCLEELEIEGVTKAAAESAKEIEKQKKNQMQGESRVPFKLTIAPGCN